MSISKLTMRRALAALAIAAGLYLVLAYALAPWAWRHHEHQTQLAGKSMVTTTRLGIPGDALDVGLEGERDEVLCAMRDAGWSPADPVTLRSSAHIAGSVLARRAYPTAPVSDLFYDGRRQDLAFEKPSGVSPSRRHHVRFWKALDKGDAGVPVWLGAATYDRGVGVSHYTGQITHHVAPDIDSERDFLASDLTASGHVAATYSVRGVGPTLFARNGGGDPYYTDGEISFLRLAPGCEKSATTPEVMGSPPAVEAKKAAFGWVARVWRAMR